MKTLFKILGSLILIAILAFVVIGIMLPNEYHVEREIVIDAKPEVVHQYVGDLNKWPTWSPWEVGDPSIVVTVGTPSTGVGATQSWSGDSGTGSLTFTSSDPQKGIKYDLLFEEGAYKAVGQMVYEAQGENQTKVIWMMDGSNDMAVIGGYLSKAMDTMVGPMFDLGLMQLDTAVTEKK